jgi:general secretion pathway protein I
MSRAWTSDSGFSLVEALVALFVFALAGVAVVQLQTYSLQSFTRVERQALGGIVAQNKLTEAVAAAQAPDLGTTQGVEALGGRSWGWRMLVSPTADPATRRIDVEVGDVQARLPAAKARGFVTVSGP